MELFQVLHGFIYDCSNHLMHSDEFKISSRFSFLYSRRGRTFSWLSFVLELHWPVRVKAQQTRWQPRRQTNNFCTLQDDVIKTLIKIKFSLCYSDCKTKQQRPLCSWFPSAPDREPIPRCPTGLSGANKTIKCCLTVFTTVFTIFLTNFHILPWFTLVPQKWRYEMIKWNQSLQSFWH